MDTKVINGSRFRLLFSIKEIHYQIKKIAAAIKEDFKDSEHPPVLVTILKGGMYFGVDLSRALSDIDCEHEMDTIALSSYRGDGNGGAVKLVSGPQSFLAGRDLIIVEDVLDRGDTLRFIADYFRQAKLPPRSVSYCVLIKKQQYAPDLRLSYFGFVAPNAWLVGNGMDSNGCYRGLTGIYQKIGVRNNAKNKKPFTKTKLSRTRVLDRGDLL